MIDFSSYLFVEPAEETNQEAILQELEFVVVNNEDLSKQSKKLIDLRDRLIQHFTYISERVALKQPDVIFVGNQLLSCDPKVAASLSPSTFQSRDITKLVICIQHIDITLGYRDLSVYNRPKVRIS